MLLYFLLVSGKPSIQKRSQKPGVNRKFQFFVYSPDVDRECEALKVCCMLYVVCCMLCHFLRKESQLKKDLSGCHVCETKISPQQ